MPVFGRPCKHAFAAAANPVCNAGALDDMAQKRLCLGGKRRREVKPGQPTQRRILMLHQASPVLMLLKPRLNLRQSELAGHPPVVVRGVAKRKARVDLPVLHEDAFGSAGEDKVALELRLFCGFCFGGRSASGEGACFELEPGS